MPYVRCPNCRLSSYSAAHYTSVDGCPACGAELDPEPGADVNEWLARGIVAELGQGIPVTERRSLMRAVRRRLPHSVEDVPDA